ncbi:MAG: hypothetical protein WCO33_03005 [bacterium]
MNEIVVADPSRRLVVTNENRIPHANIVFSVGNFLLYNVFDHSQLSEYVREGIKGELVTSNEADLNKFQAIKEVLINYIGEVTYLVEFHDSEIRGKQKAIVQIAVQDAADILDFPKDFTLEQLNGEPIPEVIGITNSRILTSTIEVLLLKLKASEANTIVEIKPKNPITQFFIRIKSALHIELHRT